MQLSSIKQFLEVYRKSLTSEDEKRSKVISIIKEVTGIDLDERSLVFKKEVLEIKTNTVVKNEIFFHKEKILLRIKEETKLGIYNIC